MSGSRCRQLVVVAIVCLLAAGCGSTLDRDRAAAQAAAQAAKDRAASGDSDGDTPDAAGAEADRAAALPDATPGAGARAGGTTGGGRATGGTGGTGRGATQPGRPGSPAAPGAGPGAVAQGVTASTIDIGVGTWKNGSTASGALGFQFDPGDTTAQAQAVIDYLNARGGLAGRKIRPVYYDLDVTNGTGPFEPAACAKWTEDNKVFAVVNASLAFPMLLACLAKKNTLGYHDVMNIDDEMFKEHASFFYTGGFTAGITYERSLRAQVKELGDAGWFGNGAKVGIIYLDEPVERRAVERTLVPALAARGIPSVAQGAPHFTEKEANYAAYVLRFQQENVTHVMFVGDKGGYPLAFSAAAESQRYRPKYGLRSDNQMALLLQGKVPAEQLRGALGIGWSPVIDVDNTRDPGPVSNNEKLCVDIMTKAKQDMANRQAKGRALIYCDGLFFFQKVFAEAVVLNPAAVATAAEALGTRHESPITFQARFGPGRHDAVGAIRLVSFDVSCECFKYSSPPKVIQ